MRNLISRETVVPLGIVAAIVAATISIVRIFEAQATEVATLRVVVENDERRISLLESRADQAERDDAARWIRILDDLAKIKERLGIVENRPPK